MTPTKQLTIAAIIAVVAIAACAQGNLPQPVQAAIEDLAGRLDVAPDAITVASFEEVTWPDTSLGNPEPGRVYAQVLTPGYRVMLEAQGQRYEYHTDRGTRVTLMEPGGEETPAAEGEHEELHARLRMIRRAGGHLAQQLGIEINEVYLASVEEVTWPDASLGAPRPGETYAQVQTPGYRLLLEAAGQLHEYHTDTAGRVVTAEGTMVAGVTEVPAASEQPEVVSRAVADLAGRLGIDQGQITVVSVEALQWPDSSLGLPDPGMMYPQAIVPGHRIVLAAEGRRFEYHSAGGTAVRYAGIVYPEDAEVSVLALQPTEPADGNNRFHLQRIDPRTGESEIAVQFISKFAATPDGRDIAVVKRTSRSSHELGYVQSDGSVEPLDGGFDVFVVAWSPLGERLAYWVRPRIANEVFLRVLNKPWGEPEELSLPGAEPGSFQPGNLVWTNDALAVTVTSAAGARSFLWDGEEMRDLGQVAVLGWIPRSSSLLIRDEDGKLIAVIPERGKTAELVSQGKVLSAAAPAGERYVIAAVEENDVTRLLRVEWGGQGQMLRLMTNVSEVSVEVAPVGGIFTVSRVFGDTPLVDIMELGEPVGTLQQLQQPGPAIPVAN